MGGALVLLCLSSPSWLLAAEEVDAGEVHRRAGAMGVAQHASMVGRLWGPMVRAWKMQLFFGLPYLTVSALDWGPRGVWVVLNGGGRPYVASDCLFLSQIGPTLSELC